MRSSTSDIFSETFNDIRSDPILLLPLLLANLVYYALTIAVGVSLATSTVVSDMASQGLSATNTLGSAVILVTLVGGIAYFVGYCLLQCMAVEVISEGGTSLGSSFRLLGSRLIPFVATSILVGVILFLIMVTSLAVGASLGLAGMLGSFVVIMVGTLLLLMAPPATVYSDLGPLEAVADSFKKAKANMFRMLGFVVITFVLALGIGLLSSFVMLGLGLAGAIISVVIAVWFSTVVPVALTRLYADIDLEEKQRQADWLQSVASQTVARPLDQF